VLGQPALARGLLNSEAKGQLFEAYSIAAILGVDAVDQLFFEVYVNPAFVDIFAGEILQLTLGMNVS
jgi:hypothetical protein